ncbi:MAG TPA: hypothetical protein VHE81_06355, partial [Lacipirellulaceae bacterium]|nr:hypothetical protein [Lacipirellulaceae bacterium]
MTHSIHRSLRSRYLNRLTLLVTCVALVAAGTAVPAWARPTQPSVEDHQITLAVALLMERRHLTGHEIDDTISERTLKSFIKDLDPLKLFFYQSDIDDFNRSKDQLDEQIKRGDIRFAYEVFARFLARVDERITFAEAELNKPHDFTKDEDMIRDPDAAHFPKTPEEA